MTSFKTLRWTTQRNNILRNPDYDTTGSLKVIPVASNMTPPGPLNNRSDEDSSSEEELIELAMIVACPRRAKIIRKRVNYYEKWRGDEFIARFRMSKETTRFVLNLMGEHIAQLQQQRGKVDRISNDCRMPKTSEKRVVGTYFYLV
ncbi:hypothetical protein V9T40_009350 [Parthenolecanium corni]|uniref:Uncharacterized protein n=1 Tax=Parthenolecanium corni TaxID=536013 RepID=A0AAN9Y830_9HEMI